MASTSDANGDANGFSTTASPEQKDPIKMVPALTTLCYPPKLVSVFLAQFDNHKGRIIRCQYPTNAITKEEFGAFDGLVIPHENLCNKMIKHETPKYKIMGHAVSLCDYEKYKNHRNYFMWNLCFALEKYEGDERILEPVLQKIADYLVILEAECDFLSSPLPNDTGALNFVKEIFLGLSQYGECNFLASSRQIIALKISLPYHFEMKSLPMSLLVPTFTRVPLPTATPDVFKKMDMVSQKITPYMNGVFTIREIANRVKIDAEIVERCVRQLIYCGTIILLPQFLYSNCYYTTEKFKTFIKAVSTQKECCEFVKRKSCLPGPEARDILRLYGGLRPGWKLSNWHARFNPRRQNVDERKLIQFGIYYGFVRKQEIYPVTLKPEDTKISKLCNGSRTIEDIALIYNTTTVLLMKLFDASPKFALIYR